MLSRVDAPEVSRSDDVARRANARRRGFVSELTGMLLRHKKWWLAPIVILLVLVGLLVVLGGGPLSPFLYPLF